MKAQSILIHKIQNRLTVGESLIEAIATALDISYDAAFRRVKLKCRMSIDESLDLAHYFGISMDELYNEKEGKYLLVEKSLVIDNEEKMATYFKQSYQSISKLLKKGDGQMYYSAKDLPLFYTLDDSMLSRFKYYVWLKIVEPHFKPENFEAFAPRPETLIAAKQLGSLYKDLKKHEIWDLTTINSTLKQIQYYFEAGQLTQNSAIEISYQLQSVLKTLENDLRHDSSATDLYYSELLLLNNNVLVSTPQQYSLFVPHHILAYFQTHNLEMCRNAEQFIRRQLKSSKSLNSSGEKEIKRFFGKLYKKTEALTDWIMSSTVLDVD